MHLLRPGIITAVGFLFALVAPSAFSQDRPSQSVGVVASFAPTSSHILIGISRQRQTWTTGAQYGYTFWKGQNAELAYEGSLLPFFQERDPELTGEYAIVNGADVPVARTPYRVVSPSKGYIEDVMIGSNEYPAYGIYGTETTYGFAAMPAGVRLNGFRKYRIQPTFSVDAGFVVSKRDLPIDGATSFNFIFSFGPGIEYQLGNVTPVRFEYVFYHLSNANRSTSNPGVDSGMFRITLSRRF